MGPNPTNGRFNLNFSGTLIKELEVVDNLGQVVFATSEPKRVQNNNIQIDFDQLMIAPGIYHVSFKAGDTKVYQRVIYFAD
jgi:hypothetical protein